MSPYAEPSPYAEENQRTNPVRRLRWATQRVTGRRGTQKRKSIFNRHLARMSASEKKRESGGTDPDLVKPELELQDGGEGDVHSDDHVGRTIYFNIPLPATMRDSEGRPLQHYKRNKIRTAKYTPISFIPKNLWWQFHNIAMVYFLAIIILDVRTRSFCLSAPTSTNVMLS